MYVHHKKKLIVSVYVDEFKIAGVKENLRGMIAKLSTRMELDEAVPLNGDVYLGCKQADIPPPTDIMKEKSDLYNSVMFDKIPDPDCNVNRQGLAIRHARPRQTNS